MGKPRKLDCGGKLQGSFPSRIEFEDDEPVSSWRCTQCGVIYCGIFPPSKTLTVTVDMVCTGKRPTLADVFNKAFPEGATCDALRKDKRFK